jgi:hypothetical protein
VEVLDFIPDDCGPVAAGYRPIAVIKGVITLTSSRLICSDLSIFFCIDIALLRRKHMLRCAGRARRCPRMPAGCGFDLLELM